MNERPHLRQIVGMIALGASILGLSAGAAWALRERLDRRPAVRPVLASRPSPRDARGSLLYQVHCARCHGPEGHGDGPDAERLQPPPRDFASAHWRFGATPEMIRKVTVEGIPGTAMFGWGGSLSAAELDAVVGHVRSLAPKRDAVDPATLEPLLKAAGFAPQLPSRLAPPLKTDDLDGRPHALDETQGTPTLVVFWGTSCIPCLDELPELERLADTHRGRITILPVCVDEPDRTVVHRVAAGRLARLPAYVCRDATAPLAFGVQELPTAVLLDREGRLIGLSRGTRQPDNAAFQRLLDALHAPSGLGSK